jgi:hypothetical protein
MIKFFRKIRYQLLGEGKTGKYLKYAIGEILLIVVGVLIAISVSDWSKNSNNRITEQRLLSGLEQGILKDKNIIEDELVKTNQAIVKLKQLHSLLDGPILQHSDDLNFLLGTVYGMRILNLDRALYEELKSIGLGIIQDEKLKSQIITVFENDYKMTDRIKENEQSVNLVNRPYYLSNFTSIQFSSYAIPLDIKKIWKDPYYKNIVYYRLVTLEYNQKLEYENILHNMDVLLERIRENK